MDHDLIVLTYYQVQLAHPIALGTLKVETN
jgi:hypothetical protein